MNRLVIITAPDASVEMVEITCEEGVMCCPHPPHDDISLQIYKRLIDEGVPVEPYVPPPPVPIVVAALDFYRRLTDEEGVKVENAIQSQPFLKRQIFLSAQTFRSDAPGGEWELLQTLANGLFGPERAAELLAPSES